MKKRWLRLGAVLAIGLRVFRCWTFKYSIIDPIFQNWSPKPLKSFYAVWSLSTVGPECHRRWWRWRRWRWRIFWRRSWRWRWGRRRTTWWWWWWWRTRCRATGWSYRTNVPWRCHGVWWWCGWRRPKRWWVGGIWYGHHFGAGRGCGKHVRCAWLELWRVCGWKGAFWDWQRVSLPLGANRFQDQGGRLHISHHQPLQGWLWQVWGRWQKSHWPWWPCWQRWIPWKWRYFPLRGLLPWSCTLWRLWLFDLPKADPELWDTPTTKDLHSGWQDWQDAGED